MKHIVILCDGTWNVLTAPYPTHVAQLTELIQERMEEIPQVVRYLPGVGTGRGQKTWLGKRVDQFLGGGLGIGLRRNIRDAYVALCKAYAPQDRVYVFGYSRGAYTARSLVGLIRSVGIVPAERIEAEADRVMDYYKSRSMDTHPRNPASYPDRQRFSPDIATSQDELDWRGGKGWLFELAYLGLWDTVGALGVPAHLGVAAAIFNRRALFHDTALSSMVKRGRHAVSIDEDRLSFRPTLWANLPYLNEGPQGPNSRYEELWFAGDHSVMGGGGPDDRLSSYPFDWVLRGAIEEGLRLDEAALAERIAGADPMGALSTTPPERRGPLSRLYRRAPRLGPYGLPHLAPPVLKRWCVTRDAPKTRDRYTPDTLKHLTADLLRACARQSP